MPIIPPAIVLSTELSRSNSNLEREGGPAFPFRASHLRPFSLLLLPPSSLTLHRFTSRFEEGEDSKSKFPCLLLVFYFPLFRFPTDNFVVAAIPPPPLLPLLRSGNVSTRTRLIFPQRRDKGRSLSANPLLSNLFPRGNEGITLEIG